MLQSNLPDPMFKIKVFVSHFEKFQSYHVSFLESLQYTYETCRSSAITSWSFPSLSPDSQNVSL
jgi:hypothetical protein